METRFEFMMPREIEAAMAACPTLYIPLGTIEWHGLQNIVGLDALKAHRLCVLAAETGGGIVHPPVYGGVGGLDEPHTIIMDPEECLESNYLRPWIEKMCAEACRLGFRAVLLLTGHYGAAQQIIVREAAVRMTRVLDIPVLGTPEYILALDEGYYGDHAAFFETSLMMHLHPGDVDVSRLGESPHQGVYGGDPRQASAEDGKRLSDVIVARLAQLATAMPQWDTATREGFARAEAALVGRQLELAASRVDVWKAWRNMEQGVLDGYPGMLVEERFEEIAALAQKL